MAIKNIDRIKSLARTGYAPAPGTPAKAAEPTSILGTGGGPVSEDMKDTMRSLRIQVTEQLFGDLDLSAMKKMDKQVLEEKLVGAVSKIAEVIGNRLTKAEREELVHSVIADVLGLGPLEKLMADPSISDIMINGPKDVFIERKGRLEKTQIEFDDNKHLLGIIDRIVTAVGRRVDETSPMVDARMRDGSRFNAIIPPLALDGPSVSIRRFGNKDIQAQDLVTFGSLPQAWLDLLRGCVQCKLNVIVSGGTGSGKTTMLNALSSFIPESERIVTIEDSAELRLQQEHVIRLETRPPNLEGRGGINQRDLVMHSLRMRPDRIILGEIRGAEAIDMLTAMNTGNDGSMATVHANSTRDALARFETMVSIGMPNMSDKTVRETIARALDVIVQLDRLIDGTRRTLAITEITGMEKDVITVQDIFYFDQETIDERGNVVGTFRGSGLKPGFLHKLRQKGFELPDEIWKNTLAVNQPPKSP